MTVQLAFPEEPNFTFPTRMQMIEDLAAFRQEWELAANGQSLVDVETSVGLVLADVTALLGLTNEEQYIVLGRNLYNEMAAILDQQIPQ